ncbi:MAG: tRNA (adenosine(37)-N6)-threonylcarbamoyltransferase complex dimerization subunit type 1 TsaB [Ruminococcaceae bacterium]|nr:tRNA (adenosine(37)-N6)-threonylcarbamoyltransferase complex dimerization subunit type 1 TsaB [Oscillospiraceae bacterium]
MIVLGVDSSATAASAAIIVDGRLVSEVFSDTGLTHSQTLLPMIDSCLKMAGVSVDEINMIAVANGPGSFTGVRIGISTVKGIAFTNNVSCVEVSTLECMAYNQLSFDGIICSVMDARCNQVYTAFFESVDGCKVNRLSEDNAMSIDELGDKIAELDKKVIFVGDGADICYNKLKDRIDNICIAQLHMKKQRASSVAMCGLEKDSKKPKDITVNYIRLPQAQRELLKR